jgi:transposase, IS30 family
MLFSLRQGRSAEQVRNAMTEVIQSLPPALRGTLTWDQGNDGRAHPLPRRNRRRRLFL